jgi:hypothetical protein
MQIADYLGAEWVVVQIQEWVRGALPRLQQLCDGSSTRWVDFATCDSKSRVQAERLLHVSFCRRVSVACKDRVTLRCHAYEGSPCTLSCTHHAASKYEQCTKYLSGVSTSIHLHTCPQTLLVHVPTSTCLFRKQCTAALESLVMKSHNTCLPSYESGRACPVCRLR